MVRGIIRITGILVLANLFGCYPGPGIGVIPSGSGVRAAPKKSDCKVDFFRTKIDRPYDELAVVHVDGYACVEDFWPSDAQVRCAMGVFQEEMRVKACGVGADAVIVTQDYSPLPRGRAFMNGIAIKYRAASAAAAGIGTLPEAQLNR